jgi:hypothetical protein
LGVIYCENESGISKPVFFNAGLAVNKEVSYPNVYQYIINLFKNAKIVFWPDLAYAHYGKDTLVRLEEQKIEYVSKKENPPNVAQIPTVDRKFLSELENEGLQQQLSSKR